jgi:predicted O-methyltransferase YrrM
MPKRIFEFGTFDGATTILLASACPAAEVFTLDLDCGSVNATQPAAIKAEVDNVLNGGIGSRIAGNPAAGRIHQLVGDSASFDYTQYHNSIDLAFIDACHDYAYVKSDTANALRMVPRGIIVWHDYNPGWPGVISAVDELLPKHRITHIAGTTLAVLDRSGE